MKENKHPEWNTGFGERTSYYVYCVGQNGIYTLVSTFLSTYLLFSGINPAISAAVLFAVKIWDAVNDALFGVIFDKLRFKSGKKHIPWLKLSSVLVPIATVLLFCIPTGFEEGGKVAWFAIAYILWDTVYTFSDVPFYGLINTMTDRMDERTGMMSVRSIWGGAGAVLAYIVGYVLVSESVGLPYWVAALVMSAIGMAVMLPLCFKAKERHNAPPDADFTIKAMLKYLISNKYLLIYYLGIVFYSGFAVSTSLNTYASFYIFGDSMFGLIVTLLSVAPTLICALFVPSLVRKFDKMKIYMICVGLMAAMSILMFFVARDNKWVYLGLSVVKAIPFGVVGVMMFMFTPDCAEYGKFKTGVDAKGITFAIQTFVSKLTAAISGSLGLALLAVFSFKVPEEGVESFEELAEWNAIAGNAQTSDALDGLWFTYVIFPAIGFVLALIVWAFYRLKDKDVQIMTDCNSGKISREEAEKLLSRKY